MLQTANGQRVSPIKKQNYFASVVAPYLFLTVVLVVVLGLIYPTTAISILETCLKYTAAVSTAVIAVFTIVLVRSTNKLWKAEKTTLETISRAFVYIDGFDFELTTLAEARRLLGQQGKDVQPRVLDYRTPEYVGNEDLCIVHFVVAPRWKNSGDTPTNNMKVSVDTAFLSRDDPATWDPHGRGYLEQPFFLPPKATEASSYIDLSAVARINISDNIIKPLHHKQQTEQATQANQVLIIYGRASYDDVFGRPHFLEWRYEVRFENHRAQGVNAHFIQWKDHNMADVQPVI